MRVDFRAGKVYSGPNDPKFLQDTIYHNLKFKAPDSGNLLIEEMKAAFDNLPKDLVEVTKQVAEQWHAASPFLLYKQAYCMAGLLGCQYKIDNDRDPGEPRQIELDGKKLVVQIAARLAAEWEEVQKASLEAQTKPSVLTLAVAGNAEALQAHLQDLQKHTAPQKSPPNKSNTRNISFGLFQKRLSASAQPGPEEADVAAPRILPKDAIQQALLETDDRGCTPLHFATMLNNTECVKILLEAARTAGVDVLKKVLAAQSTGPGRDHDHDSVTPLFEALHLANVDIVLAFLRAGADFKADVVFYRWVERLSGLTLLIRLASKKPTKYLAQFIAVLEEMKKKDPNFDINMEISRHDSEDSDTPPTPSREAPHSSDANRVDGADEQNNESEDPLEPEPASGADEMEDLEPMEDEIDRIDSIFAAMREYADDLRFSRRFRGARSQQTKATFLSTAALRGGIDAVLYLLSQGAVPSGHILVDTMGALEVSAGEFSVNGAAWLAILQALIQAGADVNATDPYSRCTVLHWAALRGSDLDLAAAQLLLASGADTQMRNSDDETALELAQIQGNSDIAELLTRENRLKRLLSAKQTPSMERRKVMEEEQLPDDQKCAICLQRKKEVICAPCGHKSMCRRCTRTLLTRSEAERKCPMCRDKMESYVVTVYET